MIDTRLRAMTPADIPEAVTIERLVYPQPWSQQVFEEELARPDRVYLAADASGRLAGYGGIMFVGDEAHITTLAVHPHHRGRRLGTRLMLGLVEAALDRGARSLTLEVRVSNLPAQRIYRRFGMAPVGVRKRYYRDEDALIMWAHDIDDEEYRRRIDEIREEIDG
ncbi:MAG: putative ribosomal-protein-alanine acetyltransferase [Acidimicrobiia bacterium]|nr:MAG: putative ribosomal-protein-alanine acetyltransferase [Acidimicrobiia bacterium]